jgi:adenylosuccinate synthase
VITAVVGGQFGSEGKGAVVADLAHLYPIHVRVGAANAGHTFYTGMDASPYNSGDERVEVEKHVVQQLPCAAYANPGATCVLGPGALISIDILREEIKLNDKWRHEHGHDPLRLLVDYRAHIVHEDQIRRESETDLAERIGSTSTKAREGIGQATADRVMREAGCKTALDGHTMLECWARPMVEVGDAVEFLHLEKEGSNILLEGTQGAGLSITTGYFPYCTSRNTTAAGLAADCGLAPADVDHCVIVMRTYPIRVAGNSGPFYPDSKETTFAEIGVDPETTTVTRLERRVATFSYVQAVDAVRLNRAPSTEIALMFGDYVVPELAGSIDLLKLDFPSPEITSLLEIMRLIYERTKLPVTMVGTGPHSIIRTVPSVANIESSAADR